MIMSSKTNFQLTGTIVIAILHSCLQLPVVYIDIYIYPIGLVISRVCYKSLFRET